MTTPGVVMLFMGVFLALREINLKRPNWARWFAGIVVAAVGLALITVAMGFINLNTLLLLGMWGGALIGLIGVVGIVFSSSEQRINWKWVCVAAVGTAIFFASIFIRWTITN